MLTGDQGIGRGDGGSRKRVDLGRVPAVVFIRIPVRPEAEDAERRKYRCDRHHEACGC